MRKTETIVNEVIICDLCHEVMSEKDIRLLPGPISYYPAGAKEPIMIDICYHCITESVNFCNGKGCRNYMSAKNSFIDGTGDYLCRKCAILERGKTYTIN